MSIKDFKLQRQNELNETCKALINAETVLELSKHFKKNFKEMKGFINTGSLNGTFLLVVDYTQLLNEPKLKKIIERRINSGEKYSQEELLLYHLQIFYPYYWKLGFSYLSNFKKCLQAEAEWNKILLVLAEKIVKLSDGSTNYQPYWLRNCQLLLESVLSEEELSQLQKKEVFLRKSNSLQACCSKIKDYRLIELDSGLYVFLTMWYKDIMKGVQVVRFNQSGMLKTNEPIKSLAATMHRIITIIHGPKESDHIKCLPLTQFFSEQDMNSAQLVVDNQIMFILGHEYGHMITEQEAENKTPREKEYLADAFAINKILTIDYGLSSLKVDMTSSQKGMQENSKDIKILSVELLMLFFDFYFYMYQHIYKKEPDTSGHPEIAKRRKEIKKKYKNNTETEQIIKYAESLIERSKDYVNNQFDEDIRRYQ